MPRICVIGTGYVGLVTAACFAELGHKVSCVDVDQAKVASLKAGIAPFYEPGLEPILQRHLRSGQLKVTTDTAQGIQKADFVFFCVGTPSTPSGQVDLSYLHLAYMNVKAALGPARPIMVNKSTVPPGTADMMSYLLSDLNHGRPAPAIVSNPEFLREGKAIEDFMQPSRVVVGAKDPAAANKVASLYSALDAPLVMTDTRTAEMIKYVSNAFLATKVSFINEMATLCERLNVNVSDVSNGIGLDPRIAREFLNAGLGYGGSCLPKDTGVLQHIAYANNITPSILTSVIEVNSRQPERLIERIEDAEGSLDGVNVAVLGLAFKPNTDDIRYSPSIELVEQLLRRGAKVRVTDPEAWKNSAVQLQDRVVFEHDPYDAADGAEIVILATEWRQYRQMDLRRLRAVMRGDLFVDGRIARTRAEVTEAGLRYIGVGCGAGQDREPVNEIERRVPESLGALARITA